jgi:pimeloyl-ACP methyl ester carboxylesterase
LKAEVPPQSSKAEIMNLAKKVFQAVRWLVAIFILVFALATFMGKSYGQTLTLTGVAILLVYWPKGIKERLSPMGSNLLRILLIVCLIVLKQTAFQSAPKTSIYLSPEHQQAVMAAYDASMRDWPSETEDIYLNTEYGRVHVLACGKTENPPLVMLHAASMGAHSWAENLEPVLDHYRIYAIDNPGEGNKSELNDALTFPSSPEEIADFYASLLDSLRIERTVVFGASNGGFIAQNLAYYHPERVYQLALFGPMGITQLTNSSIAMMGVATMYPFDFIRDIVAQWALGTNPACHQKYGDWFEAILRGTIPSIGHPRPMTQAQKQAMDMPVLLFLGSEDKIVGDAATARQAAMDYPDIQIETLKSGHLIAVDQKEKVNESIAGFLDLKK